MIVDRLTQLRFQNPTLRLYASQSQRSSTAAALRRQPRERPGTASPGTGQGVVAGAPKVSDGMLLAAAEAVAEAIRDWFPDSQLATWRETR